MLPKYHRLTKRKDFERIWKYGKGFFVKEIGFKLLKNNLDCFRFAFIVSTKISKEAVVRNKIKRRLREIIHKRLPAIKSGFDCIVVTRSGIEKLSYREMEEKIEEILTRLSLL
jgi:ribonuclease P protein component